MKNLDIIFDLLSYEGAATNDPADAVKIKNKINETQITSLSRQQLQILTATVDQAIALPDPNSDYLIILTDQDISIKLNGSSTVQALPARGNNLKTLVLYVRGPVTSLTMSNSSGKTANVDILVANK